MTELMCQSNACHLLSIVYVAEMTFSIKGRTLQSKTHYISSGDGEG